MFSCEAQLFLRFLALGFRNLPLYPGPEKRSFLSKMSQKPSFSPCAASTQPKTKPEDISASFPVENRIPQPPGKTDNDISKFKKPAVRRVPPQGLREQATFKHTESPFPGRSSRLLQESRTVLPAETYLPCDTCSICPKSSTHVPAVFQTMNKVQEGPGACPRILSRTLKEPSLLSLRKRSSAAQDNGFPKNFCHGKRHVSRSRHVPPQGRSGNRPQGTSLFRHAETGRVLFSPLPDVSSPKICPASPPPSEESVIP